MYFVRLLINFISTVIIVDLTYSPITKVSHPYNKVGNAKVSCIYIYIYIYIYIFSDVFLLIPVIWKNVDILSVIFFTFWYEIMEQPK